MYIVCGCTVYKNSPSNIKLPHNRISAQRHENLYHVFFFGKKVTNFMLRKFQVTILMVVHFARFLCGSSHTNTYHTRWFTLVTQSHRINFHSQQSDRKFRSVPSGIPAPGLHGGTRLPFGILQHIRGGNEFFFFLETVEKLRCDMRCDMNAMSGTERVKTTIWAKEVAACFSSCH